MLAPTARPHQHQKLHTFTPSHLTMIWEEVKRWRGAVHREAPSNSATSRLAPSATSEDGCARQVATCPQITVEITVKRHVLSRMGVPMPWNYDLRQRHGRGFVCSAGMADGRSGGVYLSRRPSLQSEIITRTMHVLDCNKRLLGLDGSSCQAPLFGTRAPRISQRAFGCRRHDSD